MTVMAGSMRAERTPSLGTAGEEEAVEEGRFGRGCKRRRRHARFTLQNDDDEEI